MITISSRFTHTRATETPIAAASTSAGSGGVAAEGQLANPAAATAISRPLRTRWIGPGGRVPAPKHRHGNVTRRRIIRWVPTVNAASSNPAEANPAAASVGTSTATAIAASTATTSAATGAAKRVGTPAAVPTQRRKSRCAVEPTTLDSADQAKVTAIAAWLPTTT